MFIAHLPAGYLLTKFLIKQKEVSSYTKQQHRALLFIGLLGSILPDLDLLYFFLIDNRQHGHHSYWTHIPYYWTTLFLISFVYCKMVHANRFIVTALLVLYLNIMLHLVLDTLVGGIHWLYPINQSYLYLVDIQPRFQWWVWNFVLHWTFALELLIILLAMYKIFNPLFSKYRLYNGTITQTLKGE